MTNETTRDQQPLSPPRHDADTGGYLSFGLMPTAKPAPTSGDIILQGQSDIILQGPANGVVVPQGPGVVIC